jgi:voltage-gated potassium channel Kch
MKKATLSDRLRYGFDNAMSKGITALIAWLALVSLAVILVVSLSVWFAEISSESSLGEQFWVYLAQIVGAKAMTDRPWAHRLPQLIVTYTGVFVTGALIGILTTGMNNRFSELRKGRSKVIEAGHTVLLGWTPKALPIISDLVIANANKPRSCITILGSKEKVEMEDELRDKLGDTGRTRVVCRSGDPLDVADLGIVGLGTAKAVIVLGPQGAGHDSSVLKTMLAIQKNRSDSDRLCHVVAEVHDPGNLAVARIVGGESVELLFTGSLIARIMAQTCRQSGLPIVYTELLNFEGDEIYFHSEPRLTGTTFGEALLRYEDSALIGLRGAKGSVKLNPPMTTVIQEGDEVIAISEDDDTVRLSALKEVPIDVEATRPAPSVEQSPEQVLVLGWNRRAVSIIRELDKYAAPGSTVAVLADCEGGEAAVARCCPDLRNQVVTFTRGDTTDRSTLDALDLACCAHVIVLPYSDALGTQEADARTLITLLHLRDIGERTNSSFSVVSEMLDMRNRDLAEVSRADDFIVSDRLVSLVLSQVSENRALGAVFADLFSAEGSEIYVKPAESYVELGRPVSFYTVVEAARQRAEVALGYRKRADADDAAKGYGVVLNPRKSNLITFEAGDQVIVLAER